jgi:hypothetical protein
MHSEAARAAQLAWEAFVVVTHTHAGADLQSQARALYGALAPWVEAVGSLEVRRAGPFLLVNGVRIGLAPAERALVRRGIALLRAGGLEGLRLTRGITVAELETWVELAAEPALAHHVAGGVVVQLRAAGVCHIEAMVATPGERRAAILLPAHRQQAFAAYTGALIHERAFTAAAARGEPASLQAVRRAVHRLVDTMLEDDTALLGLTALRSLRLEAGTVAPAHAVNVAVLAIAMGRTAGFDRFQLSTLGLAGLLHDVGTHAGVEDDPARTDSLASHAVRGAARLLRNGDLGTVGTAALVALEHHVHGGESSAPHTSAAWEPSTASRIVQIADAFDRGCDSSTSNRREVLAALQRQAGACFDPGWVARFVRSMGAFPPASVVQLDRGDIGVVVRANREARGFERPIVRLLLDPARQPYVDESCVDLAAFDTACIQTVLSPDALGLDAVGLFLP